jgi:hypothetical protein
MLIVMYCGPSSEVVCALARLPMAFEFRGTSGQYAGCRAKTGHCREKQTV